MGSHANGRTEICVNCGEDVPMLIRDYGKGNLRLAVCDSCGGVADKYVEYETILQFLDVMLFRPRVYRHLLFNRSNPIDMATVVKMLCLLVLLDTNVKAYLVDSNVGYHHLPRVATPLTACSFLQLGNFSLWLVLLSLMENAAYIATVLVLVRSDPFRRGWDERLRISTAGACSLNYAFFQQIATVLCVGSFGKFFALLTVIWEYHWSCFHVIAAVVSVSHALSLRIYLREGEDSVGGRLSVLTIVLLSLGIRFMTQLVFYQLGWSPLFYVVA